MDGMDGKKLWMCRNGHVMGVISRSVVKREVRELGLVSYKTSVLTLYREAQMPENILDGGLDVAGQICGRMLLSFSWCCSMPGCHAVREWKPDEEALGWLRERYGQEEGV